MLHALREERPVLRVVKGGVVVKLQRSATATTAVHETKGSFPVHLSSMVRSYPIEFLFPTLRLRSVPHPFCLLMLL